MRNKILNGVFIVLLGLSSVAHAQEGQQPNIDKMMEKMTKELSLAPTQIEAVKTILTEYILKRQEIMEDGDAITEASQAQKKELLLALKEDEDQKLSKVLTPEQMDKLHEKEHMRQMLNKDKIDFQDYLWSNSSGAGVQSSNTIQF